MSPSLLHRDVRAPPLCSRPSAWRCPKIWKPQISVRGIRNQIMMSALLTDGVFPANRKNISPQTAHRVFSSFIGSSFYLENVFPLLSSVVDWNLPAWLCRIFVFNPPTSSFLFASVFVHEFISSTCLFLLMLFRSNDVVVLLLFFSRYQMTNSWAEHFIVVVVVDWSDSTVFYGFNT